jgi:predicted dehydrogenase
MARRLPGQGASAHLGYGRFRLRTIGVCAMTEPSAYGDRAIRWGILGTGAIAAQFTADLALLDDAEAVAVGSRAQRSADAFADRFGIAHRHPSYDDLVADPDVDVVYVSTPHPMHHGNALLAIRAGKHVLVEKPFTINAAQARDLVAAAREEGVFLMEAMWTRFLPHVVRVRQMLADGVLGELVTVVAGFGRYFAEDRASRLFAPELGGGALLDLGIYPVSFASMVLGRPSAVTAVSDPAFTGVDAQTSMIFRYDGDAHAVITTTLRADNAARAEIVGTQARLEIDNEFYRPKASVTFVPRRGDRVRHENPKVTGGLRYQAAEVGRLLRAGRLESDVMPLDETVSIMETLDEVRRQVGLVYPGE